MVIFAYKFMKDEEITSIISATMPPWNTPKSRAFRGPRVRGRGPLGRGRASDVVRNDAGNFERIMKSSRPPIYLFTDGAASGNPGPGGWGAILRCGPLEKEMSGGFSLTTNNRMELLAVIMGLEAIKWERADVQVWSDSTYVVKAINEGWLESWEKKDWKKVKNPDLWKRFLEAYRLHKVTFHWVKGHAGHPENERCDALAVAAYHSPDLPEDEGYITETQ